MPAYVNLPRILNLGKAAYLGASYNPFALDNDPNSPNFRYTANGSPVGPTRIWW